MSPVRVSSSLFSISLKLIGLGLGPLTCPQTSLLKVNDLHFAKCPGKVFIILVHLSCLSAMTHHSILLATLSLLPGHRVLFLLSSLASPARSPLLVPSRLFKLQTVLYARISFEPLFVFIIGPSLGILCCFIFYNC